MPKVVVVKDDQVDKSSNSKMIEKLTTSQKYPKFG